MCAYIGTVVGVVTVKRDVPFHVKFTLRGTVSVLQCERIKQIAFYFFKEFIPLSQGALVAQLQEKPLCATWLLMSVFKISDEASS